MAVFVYLVKRLRRRTASVDFNTRNARRCVELFVTLCFAHEKPTHLHCMWFSTRRTVLHAARNGHISISRQRALMYDMCKGLHVDFNTGNARRCVELFVTLGLRPRKANASALHVVFHESHSLARCVARVHLRASSASADVRYVQRTACGF